MWFHQDDLSWMKLAQLSWSEQFSTPVNEHINYLFRVMFRIEYINFGWNYGYYWVVSVLIHIGVILGIFNLTKILTNDKKLGLLAGLLFSINTNWNEVVMWVSGQTISITVLVVIWTIYWVFERKNYWKIGGAILLSSITSALAAWLPVLLGPFYYKDKKILYPSILALSFMAGVYLFFSSGVGGEIGHNIWQIVGVLSLGIINTVLGRLWWPFEIGEQYRIAITFILLLMILVKWGRQIFKTIYADKRILFLLVAVIVYYGFVAIGRAQYGIGMMRAERYAYMGLALLLPVIYRVAQELKFKLKLIVGMTLVLFVIQLFGFSERMKLYMIRPSQLKNFHNQILNLDKSKCYKNEVFPEFVFGNNNTYYQQYNSLWEGWKIGGEECIQI